MNHTPQISNLEMFGLVSGRRVQRRYSLSETTLQQGKFRGMVHNMFYWLINQWGYYIYYILHTGWVKKKCDLRRLVQNCIFFVELTCMVFFRYFLKICNFFWYSNGLKKNPRTFFFSQNHKFRNAKMYTLPIYIEI